MNTENENVKRLPKHLHKFIVDQNYSKYSAVDHAVWRYIMRLNYDFLGKKAHKSYVEGLAKTGLSIEKIPKIDEMNEILSKIGWGAVCVDGFIPPSAFMEFQAYKVLVIAADIRNINHIEYTPAPDIVHEAAGHAPIIVDPAYAEYLRLFGEIGSKAISSKRDNDLYEAVRQLSIVKEKPNATKEEIAKAELYLIEIQNDMGQTSEMARLRNLHWWTVEYGLIGTLDEPQIYGAGLLSSIGESTSCLTNEVKKLPYSIKTADFNFDITTKQPQLFVTPDFTHLISVLNEFADTMAFRKGGFSSLKLAKESNSLATFELSSGIQISGIISKIINDENGNVAYVNTNSPTMLSENNKMLIGHGKNAHKDGFGTPVGKLKNNTNSLENLTLIDLSNQDVCIGQESTLEFESGVVVKGILEYIRQNNFGKILLMGFKECKVTFKNEVLFEPEWGYFDMAVGNNIVSVFAGAADIDEYETDSFISPTNTVNSNESDNQYIELYQSIRGVRENEQDLKNIPNIYSKIKKLYPNDWLLSIEIYELVYAQKTEIADKVRTELLNKAETRADVRKLILDGLKLIEK